MEQEGGGGGGGCDKRFVRSLRINILNEKKSDLESLNI